MTEPIGRTNPQPQPRVDEPATPSAAVPPRNPDAPIVGDPLPAAARALVDGHLARGRGLAPDLKQGPPASWYLDKAEAETACLLPCSLALRAAKLRMTDGGLAEKMLDHFLSGSAAPVGVDLTAELNRNPRIREYLASHIEDDIATRVDAGESVAGMSGAIWVPQNAYGTSDAGSDQQLALGGTYFEYEVVGSADNGGLQVKLNVADHYFWSPSERTRPTQCLHECGASLVSAGRATEFYQIGEGTLVVADPARTEPMTPLDVERDDDR